MSQADIRGGGVSSTFKTQLDVWYEILFGWLTRDVTGYLFAGVAALMLLLGLFFSVVRPRGIGAVLVIVHGLLGAVFAAVWHNAPARIPQHFWWTLGIVGIYLTLCITLAYWAAHKPTAKECDVSSPLKAIAYAHLLFAVALALEAYYVSTYNDTTGATNAWYIFRYIRALDILAGVMLAIVSVLAAVVRRVHAAPPFRSIEWI
jgi:hypothetical protein